MKDARRRSCFCVLFVQSQSVAFKSMATSGAMFSDIGGPSLGSNRSGSAGSRRVGRKAYQKRDVSDFSEHEKAYLDNLKKKSLLQKLHFFRVFKEPTEQLQSWLHFFDGVDDHPTYGSELQQGLIHRWSTFILLGWKCTWYGMLWTLSLLNDFFTTRTMALFLDYLLSTPSKFNWIWLCKIGALCRSPIALMLLATFTSLVAIKFTTFILYGWKVGVVCIVFEVFKIVVGTWFARLLSRANNKVIESELKKV